MKTLKFVAMVLFIGIIAVSCKKEEGPAGPQGPAGTNGTNGNANVMYFGFGPTTFTTTITENHFYIPIEEGTADSSMIIPYYTSNGFWYQVGEVGWGANYASRYYYSILSDSTRLNCQIRNMDGTLYTGADVTWDSLKVFVMPANIFKSAKNENLDFSDYTAVETYFNKK